MLTQAENEFLTRVGPGTPAGELLRRYWLPVRRRKGADRRAPHEVRPPAGRGPRPVQGQERERRAHRRTTAPTAARPCSTGASKSAASPAPTTAGSTTPRATAWRRPAEPADSMFHLTVKAQGLPGRSGSSASTGPTWARCPRPRIPNTTSGRARTAPQVDCPAPLDCNWLQAMENSVDPAHSRSFTRSTAHAGPGRRRARRAASPTTSTTSSSTSCRTAS